MATDHGLPGASMQTCVPGRGAGAAYVPAPRTALVLSGGCLRGYAQIGVLKALAAAGIRPDLVVGCSAGAVIGAMFAAGLCVAEIERAAHALMAARLKRWAFSRRGLWHLSALQALVRSHLPHERIEDFPIRFAAVATDAASGRLAVFTAGEASSAVAVSAAMPGFFVPACIGGRHYADGCLVSPLPVGVARAMGAQRVIAVNTLVDAGCPRPGGLLDALLRTPRLMMQALAAHEAAAADLVIAPELPGGGARTARERQALIDAGERHAQAALHRLPLHPDRATVAGSWEPVLAPSPAGARGLG